MQPTRLTQPFWRNSPRSRKTSSPAAFARPGSTSNRATPVSQRRTRPHAIIASSELLPGQQDIPEEAAEESRIIAESSELLLMPIGDVPDLAKIESGRVDLDVTLFFVSQIITDFPSLMRSTSAKDRERRRAGEMNDILAKPIKLANLHLALKAHLEFSTAQS